MSFLKDLRSRWIVGIGALALVVAVLAVRHTSWNALNATIGRADEPGVATVSDEAAALRADAEAIASTRGVAVDDALGVLDHQRRVDVLAARAAAEFPDEFAGVRFSDDFGQPHSVIQFKGKPPMNVAKVLGTLPPDVSVEGGARFSEVERAARVEAVHRAVVAAGFSDISTGGRGGVITVRVGSSSLLDPGLGERVTAVVADELGPVIGEIREGDLQIIQSSRPENELFSAYGGDQLHIGSTDECTSGIAVMGVSNEANRN